MAIKDDGGIIKHSVQISLQISRLPVSITKSKHDSTESDSREMTPATSGFSALSAMWNNSKHNCLIDKFHVLSRDR